MFEAFGGDRWWPLNSRVTVLRTDPGAVLEVIDSHGLGVRGRYATLEDAVAALAPHPFAKRRVEFLVQAADGSTVAMSSAAPTGNGISYDVGVAPRRLLCDCITAVWAPRSNAMLAAAKFDDFRFTPPPSDPAQLPPGRKTDQLTIHVSDQGGGWRFDRLPPGPGHAARSYEEPERYQARIKADRLPLDLLRRYVAGAGAPVHDPGYLTGPVLTLSPAQPLPAERTWSSMAELRAAAGYPADGIQTNLRAAPTRDEDGPAG